MGTLRSGTLVLATSGHPLKVLHVIPSVAPRYGGPSRAVVEMCHALKGCGVDTLISATNADGGGRLNVKIGEPVSYKDVPAIFFPRWWSEAFKYSKPLACWLNAHVADFDLVHIHAVFSHACLAAAKACSKKGVPYVVRPLGTLDPWSLKQK
ncbi:MAG TPA: glycosyltransferase, partial [Pyrinomonadaceae bacterium]|nr:glycosyltransferase [Pyrinomonadaceae bacterium]